MGATDVIHPERATARKTAMLIHHPRAVDYVELGGGQVILAGHPPRTFVGQTPSQLDLPTRYRVALLAVWQADPAAPPAPPHPDRPIAETDVLILAGHLESLRELKKVK